MDAAHHRRNGDVTIATIAPLAVGALTAVLTAGAARTPARRVRRDEREPVRERRSWRRATPVTVLALVAASLAVLLGATAAALAVSVAVLESRLRRRRAAARRRNAAEAALPDVVELIVVTVRAGYGPAGAIVEAAPFAPPVARAALDAVGLGLQRGQRLAEALGALVEHLGPGAHAVVDAIAAADRYGVALGPTLDQLSAEARAARRRAAEADARALPVRLAFPLVVCTLPSFVLLAIAPVGLAAMASMRALTP
jgi:tight adherence protein C